MNAISSRTYPRTAAQASPDSSVDRTLAPTPEAKRRIDLDLLGKAKEISITLKTNAKWMKKFLHGPK